MLATDASGNRVFAVPAMPLESIKAGTYTFTFTAREIFDATMKITKSINVEVLCKRVSLSFTGAIASSIVKVGGDLQSTIPVPALHLITSDLNCWNMVHAVVETTPGASMLA